MGYARMPEDINHLRRCLALARAKGIGCVQFKQWVQADPKLEQQDATINMNWRAADQDLEWLAEKPYRSIIPLTAVEYPPLLAAIYDPPPVLYIEGISAYLSCPQLAVVGARQASLQGKHHAERFASQFAALGIGVVSGMAVGVDAAGHHGALSVPGGWTLAILAHGLNFVYPRKHLRLAEQIREQGALVSEFSPCLAPSPGLFPRRNRIISGLSIGILVVEASLKSGSLITARMGLEQGREVFAIPGSIDHRMSAGCHELLKQGATLVDSMSDILCVIDNSIFASIKVNSAEYARVEKEQQKTCLLTNFFPRMNEMITLDQLHLKSHLTIEELVIKLANLEIQGLIERLPGGYIRSM